MRSEDFSGEVVSLFSYGIHNKSRFVKYDDPLLRRRLCHPLRGAICVRVCFFGVV